MRRPPTTRRMSSGATRPFRTSGPRSRRTKRVEAELLLLVEQLADLLTRSLEHQVHLVAIAVEDLTNLAALLFVKFESPRHVVQRVLPGWSRSTLSRWRVPADRSLPQVDRKSVAPPIIPSTKMTSSNNAPVARRAGKGVSPIAVLPAHDRLEQ